MNNMKIMGKTDNLIHSVVCNLQAGGSYAIIGSPMFIKKKLSLVLECKFDDYRPEHVVNISIYD